MGGSAFDAADVQDDAGHDAQQARKEEPVVRVPLADFRGCQQEGADNDHEETCIRSVFLH